MSENSYAWIYYLRPELLKKKGHRCEICNRTDGLLHIHHIDGNDSNNSLDNLMVVCINCHKFVHSSGLDNVLAMKKLILEGKDVSEIAKKLNIHRLRVWRFKRRLNGFVKGEKQ